MKSGVKVLVADARGEKTIPAEKFATFTEYLSGTAYQFLVTRELKSSVLKVTHKKSGFSLGPVCSNSIIAAASDYKLAGRLALKAIIEKHGEARVASAVRSKE